MSYADPERLRQYRLAWRERNREKCREYGRRWRRNHREESRAYVLANPEKRAIWAARAAAKDRASGAKAAHDAVTRALKRGDLIRGRCVVCMAEKTEAHHHLGYAKPARLSVVWLCKMHHEDAHHLGPVG